MQATRPMPRVAVLRAGRARWPSFRGPEVCPQDSSAGRLRRTPIAPTHTECRPQSAVVDLSDLHRGNVLSVLPMVAERIGLDTSSPRTLWRD